MDQYLVPANTKKSILIVGLFRKIDLLVIGIGLGVTLVFALVFPLNTFGEVITTLIPLLVTITLVSPMPNYHNIMQFLVNIYNFFTKRRIYLWKGWSYKLDGNESKTSQSKGE